MHALTGSRPIIPVQPENPVANPTPMSGVRRMARAALTGLRGMARRTLRPREHANIPSLQARPRPHREVLEELVQDYRNRRKFHFGRIALMALGTVGAAAVAAVSLGAAAPAAALMGAALAVSIGDAVCAWRDYRLAKALASGQTVPETARFLGSDSVRALLDSLFTACGVSPDKAQTAAKWGSVALNVGLAVGVAATGIAAGMALVSFSMPIGVAQIGTSIIFAATHGVGHLGKDVARRRPEGRQVIEQALAACKVYGQYEEAVQEHLPPEMTKVLFGYMGGPNKWTDPVDQQAYADGLLKSLAEETKRPGIPDQERLRNLANQAIRAHLDLWDSIGNFDNDTAIEELVRKIQATGPYFDEESLKAAASGNFGGVA